MYGTQSITLQVVAAIGIGLLAYGCYLWITADESAPAPLVAQDRSRSGERTTQLRPPAAGTTAGTGETRRHSMPGAATTSADKQIKSAKTWILAGFAALVFSFARMFLIPLVQRDN